MSGDGSADILNDILQAAQVLTGLRRRAQAEHADADGVTIDMDLLRGIEVATWGAFAQLKYHLSKNVESEASIGD